MSDISLPFTPSELKLAQHTLTERYERLVPIQIADAEIGIGPDPENDALSTCAALYWEVAGAHFIVLKIAANDFRGQFYYNEATQYGTGKEKFDNLGDCLVTLLQVQGQHERQMNSVRSTTTTADDYQGPVVI